MATLKELVAQRFGIDIDGVGDAPAEGTVAQILARGSQRHYTDRAVTDELLSVLLACAQAAPTKSDLQQYSIIVVKDPAVREALPPPQLVHLLAECGAWGVNLHDDDLIPLGTGATERAQIIKDFKQALKDRDFLAFSVKTTF